MFYSSYDTEICKLSINRLSVSVKSTLGRPLGIFYPFIVTSNVLEHATNKDVRTGTNVLVARAISCIINSEWYDALALETPSKNQNVVQ